MNLFSCCDNAIVPSAHIYIFRGQVLTDFTPLRSDYFAQYGCPNFAASPWN